MFRSTLALGLLLCTSQAIWAAPSQTTKFIRIDQFGYFPNSKKVAVIADPQTGFNSAEAFNPGTGANQYQVRRWSDDAIVFSGTIQAWNGGATHTQSGDRGWWFDFSNVTTEGSYYIFDVANNVGSYRFEIDDQVYANVLKQAMRMFYYQRCNFAKAAPYTDARWADGAWYEGSNQDRFATSRFDKGNMATAKDLHGGWIDAGDQNKYTTFAESAVIQLMEAYRMNPAAFTDDYNIPESGNGVADILDEVKYELDFLKRMQDATGTNGFLLKIGVDNYSIFNPISSDTRPRYYLPECTSSTLAGAAMFAVSGMAMKDHPVMGSYALDLIARAEAAWNRAKVTTSNFTTYQTNCDDGDIKSGDADRTAQAQLESAFVAAVYLYEATGKAEYKTFAESRYTTVNPYSIWWWGPYWAPQQMALLRLTGLPGISSTVVNNIRSQKAAQNNLYSIDQYNSGIDLYRGYMADDAYHWGHHQVRANAGQFNMDFVTFNINTTNHGAYREVAEQYLHWFHGQNPMGIVMLSNMYAHGGDSCANEIYHAWFDNNTAWDNAITSAKGPAPGYLTGGPNRSYSGTVAGITTQPVQKAYKDWNAGSPENSWEISEPAIYNQAAYVMLLSRLSPAGAPPPPPDTEAPTAPTNLVVNSVATTSVSLSWTASTDNIAVTAYDVYRNGTLVGTTAAATFTVTSLTCNTGYSFFVRAKDAAGNVSVQSNSVNATTSACPVAPSTQLIYADAIGTGWTDVSTASTRNFANATPVKTGSRSVKVDYQSNGTLAFSFTEPLATTSTTEVRFWVYAANGYNLAVYTQATDDGPLSSAGFRKTSKGRWVEMVISRSTLGNPSAIKRVVIKNNSTSAFTLYFDEIRLTNVTAGGALRTSAKVANGEAAKQDISLFPNPVQNQLTVSLHSERNEKAALKVYDAQGRAVQQHNAQLQPGINKIQLQTQQLNSGVYMLQVQTSDGIRTRQFVVRQ